MKYVQSEMKPGYTEKIVIGISRLQIVVNSTGKQQVNVVQPAICSSTDANIVIKQ